MVDPARARLVLEGGVPTRVDHRAGGDPAGAGKTQFCLTLAVAAAAPRRLGGLDAGVVFVDTEQKFSGRARRADRRERVSLRVRRIERRRSARARRESDCAARVDREDPGPDRRPRSQGAPAAERLGYGAPRPRRAAARVDSVAALARAEFGVGRGPDRAPPGAARADRQRAQAAGGAPAHGGARDQPGDGARADGEARRFQLRRRRRRRDAAEAPPPRRARREVGALRQHAARAGGRGGIVRDGNRRWRRRRRRRSAGFSGATRGWRGKKTPGARSANEAFPRLRVDATGREREYSTAWRGAVRVLGDPPTLRAAASVAHRWSRRRRRARHIF